MGNRALGKVVATRIAIAPAPPVEKAQIEETLANIREAVELFLETLPYRPRTGAPV
jgi:hypothetical protein